MASSTSIAISSSGWGGCQRGIDPAWQAAAAGRVSKVMQHKVGPARREVGASGGARGFAPLTRSGRLCLGSGRSSARAPSRPSGVSGAWPAPAWSEGQRPSRSRTACSSPTTSAPAPLKGPRSRTRSMRCVKAGVGFRRLLAWQHVRPASSPTSRKPLARRSGTWSGGGPGRSEVAGQDHRHARAGRPESSVACATWIGVEKGSRCVPRPGRRFLRFRSTDAQPRSA